MVPFVRLCKMHVDEILKSVLSCDTVCYICCTQGGSKFESVDEKCDNSNESY